MTQHEQRLDHAVKTLEYYMALPGADPDIMASMRDLLTDLLHLTEYLHEDAENIVRMALMNYDIEQNVCN